MKNLVFSAKKFHIPVFEPPFQGKRGRRRSVADSNYVPKVKLITCDRESDGNSRLKEIITGRTLSS